MIKSGCQIIDAIATVDKKVFTSCRFLLARIRGAERGAAAAVMVPVSAGVAALAAPEPVGLPPLHPLLSAGACCSSANYAGHPVALQAASSWSGQAPC